MPPSPPPEATPKMQDQAPTKVPPPPFGGIGRFTFHRVDDGLLRLDSKTGHMTFCAPHNVGWTCQTVPEDSPAMEKEISRLQDEIAALKKELADLRAAPRPPVPPMPIPPPAPPSDGKKDERTLKLPNQADLDRARAYFAETWRRLVEMLDDWKKDMRLRRDPDLSRT
jgi:hypothetical protein